MNILNLTQHAATRDQIAAGVVEPADKSKIAELLTFEENPSFDDMSTRARELARIAFKSGAKFAMVGGAPFFMAMLEGWLRMADVIPYYAFSRRQSTDKVDPETGAVTKLNVFVHTGFVEGTVRLYKQSLDEGYGWTFHAMVVGSRSYHCTRKEDVDFEDSPDPTAV